MIFNKTFLQKCDFYYETRFGECELACCQKIGKAEVLKGDFLLSFEGLSVIKVMQNFEIFKTGGLVNYE